MDPFEDIIQDRYRTARQGQDRLNAVQALIDEGIASGVSRRSFDEIMTDARARGKMDCRVEPGNDETGI